MVKIFTRGYFICLSLFLFLGVILSVSAMTHDFSIDDAPYDMVALSGLSEQDLRFSFEDTVGYLYDQRETLDTKIKNTALFNSKEINHMKDVKQIFRFLISSFWILLSFALFTSILFFKKIFPELSSQWFKRFLKRYFFSVFLFFLGLGLLLAFFFEPLFLTFHQLTFQNDDWLLSLNDDHLIQFLPENFFLKRAFQIASFFTALHTALIAGFYFFISKSKR